jgi:hypothetical protein
MGMTDQDGRRLKGSVRGEAAFFFVLSGLLSLP